MGPDSGIAWLEGAQGPRVGWSRDREDGIILTCQKRSSLQESLSQEIKGDQLSILIHRTFGTNWGLSGCTMHCTGYMRTGHDEVVLICHISRELRTRDEIGGHTL